MGVLIWGILLFGSMLGAPDFQEFSYVHMGVSIIGSSILGSSCEGSKPRQGEPTQTNRDCYAPYQALLGCQASVGRLVGNIGYAPTVGRYFFLRDLKYRPLFCMWLTPGLYGLYRASDFGAHIRDQRTPGYPKFSSARGFSSKPESLIHMGVSKHQGPQYRPQVVGFFL